MLDSSNEPIHIIKREINDKSIAYFKTLLSIVDWKHMLNENCRNNAYNEFLRIFFGLYNEAFPNQNIKIKRKSFNSPWMTKGSVKSSKKKQRLYENFLKNRNPGKELNYKQYKTLFEPLKKKSKKNYYSDLTDSHKYNIKKTWNIMKEIIGNKRVTNAPLPNFITVKNREIFDKKEIAETFNGYFVNIGPNLAASIPESKTSFQNYIHCNGPCLSTINLTDLELENAFASLKTNKSSGYDDISANVVKRVSDEIFVILKHISNISLAKGVFPDELKIARVTLIFKKGNNTLVTNYRPISVLPCFSKLLERIMYNRLYKFLLENNILYQKQFGFQNAHSPEHAILQLVNRMTEAFSQGKYTLGIFLDLSKAFDTVNHNILLEKLKAYGIQSENLKWFRSYLSNRKQFILYDDFKTEVKIVKCDVPQGSILGPLLFLIFVNDLSNSAKVLDPVLFADDTNLFCSDNNIMTLFETANQELSKINNWFLANKLSLNVEKTKYILFHKCIDQEDIPLKLPLLKLNSNIIEGENSLKFLGVILNEHLTWKKHIQLIENKFSKNVGVLYKASKLINKL